MKGDTPMSQSPVFKTSRDLVQEALSVVQTVPVAQALRMRDREDVVLVDLREAGELRKNGRIPGAFHAPRGLLEFWFDPTPGIGKAELTRDGITYLLFCAAGWRSALAAKSLQEMGVDRICHVEGGFEAWRQAGGAVELLPADSGP